jgi:hypothetical protein
LFQPFLPADALPSVTLLFVPGHIGLSAIWRPVSALFGRPGQVVVHEDTPTGSFEIVELAAVERPNERNQADQAEPERQWHEIDQDFHAVLLCAFKDIGE